MSTPFDFRLQLERDRAPRLPQRDLDARTTAYAAALRRQLTLASLRFRHLQLGPPPTGWPARPNLFYRCLNCGYITPSTPRDYDTCFCGAMSRDADAGRFGSDFGDGAIEMLESI
jgi:hypothetical protein